MGHKALCVNNGKEALEILKNEEGISLLVLDLLMAGITGVDILKHIKKQKMKVPVMIFTGQVDHELCDKALGYTFMTVLKKPARNDELKEAIGLLLSGVEVFEESA